VEGSKFLNSNVENQKSVSTVAVETDFNYIIKKHLKIIVTFLTNSLNG
jgi:hypothetical protein